MKNEVLDSIVREIAKNLLLEGLIIYDEKTDSITATAKGLVEFTKKEVIN